MPRQFESSFSTSRCNRLAKNYEFPLAVLFTIRRLELSFDAEEAVEGLESVAVRRPNGPAMLTHAAGCHEARLQASAAQRSALLGRCARSHIIIVEGDIEEVAMTRRQLTSPSEQEQPQNRADEHRAARGASTLVTPGAGAARPSPPVLAARGGAWITAMQRSAGNEAVARLMSTSRPLPQPVTVARRAETIAVRAEDPGSNVVQRGGPSPVTRVDQQIEIDLHPEPRAAGQPKTPGWRSMSLKGGTQIVYILADSKTGEALKVGKSTRASFKAGFAEYVSAGNKWGRRLKVTMFTIRQRSSKTINAFEAEIRAGMERAGFPLRWDNTNGRLGRTGKGIPVPQSMSEVELIDTVEGSVAAAKPSLTPPAPAAAPPPPRVPIASGPATRTPIAAGGSSSPPDVVRPAYPSRQARHARRPRQSQRRRRRRWASRRR